MCLGVPGKVLEVLGDDPLYRTAKVACGGVIKEITLAGVPDAQVGEFVIIHAGFAISRIDENEAGRVFDYLKQMDQALDSPEA